MSFWLVSLTHELTYRDGRDGPIKSVGDDPVEFDGLDPALARLDERTGVVRMFDGEGAAWDFADQRRERGETHAQRQAAAAELQAAEVAEATARRQTRTRAVAHNPNSFYSQIRAELDEIRAELAERRAAV